MPIVSLVFDPIVFRGEPGFLHSIQIFAYLSIGSGIILLAIWLFSKRTSKLLTGAIAGIFFAGAFLASALGVVLLPASIFGLMIVIGVLGFTPFLTAFVFLRNGIRAFRKIQTEISKGLLIGTMLLGIILVIGIPLAANWKASELVSRSINTILHSKKEEEINSAIDTLQSAFWCSNSCYEPIIWAYMDEENETRKQYQ